MRGFAFFSIQALFTVVGWWLGHEAAGTLGAIPGTLFGLGTGALVVLGVWSFLDAKPGRSMLVARKPESIRDPSKRRIGRGSLQKRPPAGMHGLELACGSCGAEIIVYYLHPGEHARCGRCEHLTVVPMQASKTSKPSTRARAYGYGTRDSLPKVAVCVNNERDLPIPS